VIVVIPGRFDNVPTRLAINTEELANVIAGETGTYSEVVMRMRMVEGVVVGERERGRLFG